MWCHAFQWSLLADANIWKDAATQMFFTLSLGFGALIAFASYMPLHNQVMRDAYTVVFINCGTSLFAGIVVFSILGYREHVTGIPATEVCCSSDQCLQTILLKEPLSLTVMLNGQGQQRLPFQLKVLSAIVVSAFYNFASICFVMYFTVYIIWCIWVKILVTHLN